MGERSGMYIRDLPIRVRLALLILFASCLAVLLASIGFALYERHSLRASAEREVTALADSLGANAAASLAFADPKTAEQMLASLATEPHVLAALLYDNHRQTFAEYRRAGTGEDLSRIAWSADGSQFDSRTLTLFRGVFLAKERIGTIALVFDLSEFRSRLLNYLQIAALVLFLSVLTAFFASFRLAQSIAKPLVQLSSVARRITSEKNYSVRADLQAGGETGSLIHSFNEMLAEIESREASLRDSEERYALAARGANDGLWDWNLVTNEIYFSPRWSHMLGYSETDHWTDPEEWFKRIHANDRERVRAEIAAHCDGRTGEFASECRMHHKSGGYIWTLSRGIAVRDQSGRAIRIAGSQSDITEGKTADPLTQIPNRLYFMDRLENAIDTAQRENTVFAVLFIDLDDFKVVNDSLGHAAGDELLIDVAGRLRGSIRSTSHHREGGQSVVARIGGDEFAILLSPIERENDAAIITQRILTRLSEPIHFEGRRMFVSASIGIAFNAPDATPDDLLRNADTAMYSAKSSGKSRVAIFNEGMRERVITRFETEAGLRKAIETNQLVLHYQPILELSENTIRGFEALVRWNHPARGLIFPGEFISIAEESDLIVHLGRWVLREACRQMAKWQESVGSGNRLTISVNVSSRQLTDPNLIADITAVLKETGLDPRSLALEVTESSIMGNPAQTLDTLQRLKKMNIRLEIDDFGTGYSSLSYLQRLPFETLKIDRSFIREIEGGGGSVDIVRAILELAHSLKMKVVAEGVETEDQIKTLDHLGSDFVQGYLLSKPLEAEAAWQLYIRSCEQGRSPLAFALDAVSMQRDLMNLSDRPM